MREDQHLLRNSERGGSEGESGVFWRHLRKRTASKLEAKAFHKLVLALITIDATCVLADLFYTFLSSDCNPDPSEDLPLWLQILSHISLAITTLFLIEIPLASWAFGLKYFDPIQGVPHASLHVFDAMIIVVTFVLEVVLKGRERQLAGLLVLLRLWRLVKLVGGIAVGAGEVNEELSMQLSEAQQRMSEQVVVLKRLEDENQRLRDELSHYRDQERSTFTHS